ncbi:MAG: tautomerase family protein [Desulfobacterales bacterium]|nr:MAG: tautomerase family protein [Desulfobacterales bacterium]
MPQVIIHISETRDQGVKSMLVKEIRQAISKTLELDTIIGQVILYESPVANRETHADRDPNFVFVEVFMYPGRDPALKKELMERFFILINRHTDVDPKNIHAVIHEIPKESYFGGMMKQH